LARQYIQFILEATLPEVNEQKVLESIVAHFLKFGARASEDSKWFVGILPTDLQAFFRAEFLKALRDKAGDPVKARKLFLSLGTTGKAIFGDDYKRTRRVMDAESKAALNTAGRVR
jgi:hypothetical protein